jgi:general stress protein 26
MPQLIIPKANEQQKALFSKFGIPLIEEMKTAEFEAAAAAYISSHNVLSLATCRENTPRCTTLEYFNNGLTVYLFSEGGGKIAKLKANPAVSFTIHDPYDSGTDYFGASGLQVWGRASLFKRKDDPEQAALIQSYYRHSEGLKRQGLYEAIQALNFNVITIEPVKINYLDLRKGFRSFVWKKDASVKDEA